MEEKWKHEERDWQECKDVAEWYPESIVVKTTSGKFKMNFDRVELYWETEEVTWIRFYGNYERIGD